MPARLEIRGTAEFRATAAKLKQVAGSGELSRLMTRRMREAAAPAVGEAQQRVRAIATSSTRGGGGQARREHTLARRKKTQAARKTAFANRGLRNSVARAVKTQVKSSGRTAGVRIRVQSSTLPTDQRKLPLYLNAGKWRHPVMGNRDRWVTQTVTPPGWFDSTMAKHGSKIRDSAAESVNVINKLVSS
ncbi:hypothetical protein L3Q67_00960 [Saccharothrix sp. AJ9571]|nr:hypothetical protein L3Q67_00960 [Saccharothrix sp. AJ9571]